MINFTVTKHKQNPNTQIQPDTTASEPTTVEPRAAEPKAAEPEKSLPPPSSAP